MTVDKQSVTRQIFQIFEFTTTNYFGHFKTFEQQWAIFSLLYFALFKEYTHHLTTCNLTFAV